MVLIIYIVFGKRLIDTQKPFHTLRKQEIERMMW